MRANFDTSNSKIIPPASGIFNILLCRLALPAPVAAQRRRYTTRPATSSSDHPAVALDEVRGVDNHPREQRQGFSHIVEQGLELGHHETQHEDDRQHRHHQQDRRVDQGGHHAVAIGLGIFQVLHQAVQHRRQLAAGLARAHHADIEGAEQRLVGRHRVAQGLAALDRGEQLRQQLVHLRQRRHIDQHFQRPVQRHTGAQQHRQFAGHRQDLLPPRRLARGTGCADVELATGFQLQQGEALAPQLPGSQLQAIRLDHPAQGLAVAPDGLVAEVGHGQGSGRYG